MGAIAPAPAHLPRDRMENAGQEQAAQADDPGAKGNDARHLVEPGAPGAALDAPPSKSDQQDGNCREYMSRGLHSGRIAPGRSCLGSILALDGNWSASTEAARIARFAGIAQLVERRIRNA